MKDSLGDRMKHQYESRTQLSLPRRTYTIIRCDGKAFHTLTKGLKDPYDFVLVNAMNQAGLALCREAQGACFGYVQSDEISVLLQDFESEKTEAWFDGNVQKIVSVSASIVTAAFNAYFHKDARFDARVFTIPDPVEVANYFVWRQKDAERNSLQTFARQHFSHTMLLGLSGPEIHELLHQKGLNWNDLPAERKRGRFLDCQMHDVGPRWYVNEAMPVFTKDESWLKSRIPRQWAE